MKSAVYIALPEAGGEAAWVIVDEAGDQARVGGGPLTAAAETVATRRAVLLAPAEDVLLTRVKLPVRNRARLRQATPFALEEHLAEDVEDLHFALGDTSGDGGETPVAVVARDRMDDWLRALSEARIPPGAVVPDVLALPRTPGRWTLLLEPGRALLRTGPHEGEALEAENVPVMLRRRIADADPRPEGLDVYRHADLDELDEDVRSLVDDCREETWGGRLEWLAGHPPETLPLDLCQDDYAVRGESRGQWGRWAVPAALAAALVILHVGSTVVELTRLGQRSQQLRAEIRSTFQSAFPEVGRIVDPQAQARQKLAELRRKAGGAGATSFLGMLSAYARAHAESDGVTIRAINYQPGQLDLQLRAGELKQVDALKERVKGAAGLVAEIQSVNNSPDGVEARMQIRRASS